jgi:hypothetical protein
VTVLKTQFNEKSENSTNVYNTSNKHELTNHRHEVVDGLDPLRVGQQVHDQISQVSAEYKKENHAAAVHLPVHA